MKKLSVFVKNNRLDIGLTQFEYAKKLDITMPTLAKIEHDKTVGLNTLKKLSKYYNLSIKLLRRMMIVEDNEQEEPAERIR
jgi:transcriptional regulator with XRE-family HTH domain